MDLLAAQTRALALFSPTQQDDPSQCEQDLSLTARAAWTCVKRRCPEARASFEGTVCARVSSTLVHVIVFELLLNAAQYKTSDQVSVQFARDGLLWSLVICNQSPFRPPQPWPVVGYRGPDADRANPGGSGIGCWLAWEAATVQSLTVTFASDGRQFSATLQGGI
jgi:hypothetical protein